MTWEHFTLDEFDCSCCGGNQMRTSTIDRFDKGRSLTGFPWIITRGWSCYRRNQIVGGSQNSAHLYGFAGDVSCIDLPSRYLIVEAAIQVGFRRIGIYPRHVHLDDSDRDDHAKPIIWLGSY